MNVLITGCAGFIGSHAVEEFLSHDHNVVGVDSMTYAADRNNMSSFINDIEFFHADICNTDLMRKLVKEYKVDWIINFAAESHVDNSIKGCEQFIKSNIVGVNSLLMVCKEFNCKILHISTDEVYGSTKSGSFIETDILNPKNPYSATKASAEHLVNSYSNTYGVQQIIIRMSNNFGPRQHKEKLVPTILSTLLSGKKIPVYGDGKNVRDWFYVKDSVKMVYTVFDRGSIGEIYNLTHCNEMTNLEIISVICELCDKDAESNIEFVKDRLGHDFRYSISNNKVKLLGINKPTDFCEAVKQTISSWRKNEKLSSI
jgi:dTDP-glucose 4,6-dehydratase